MSSSSSAIAAREQGEGPSRFRTPLEALGRGVGIEGVRWLLQSPTSRARIQAALARMLADSGCQVSLRLRSAALKPRRHLRADFAVAVQRAGPASAQVRPVAVSWRVRRGGLSAILDQEQAPGAWPGDGPFHTLAVYEPEWAMQAWAWPFDPAFPQLARLSDGVYVQELLGARSARSVSRAPSITAVRYVPGVAHVLRYDPVGSGRGMGARSIFIKLQADPRVAAVRRRVIEDATEALARETPVRLLRPLAQGEELGAVLYPAVLGGSLARALMRGSPAAGGVLAALGGAVRGLQALPGPDLLPHQTLSSELARTTHAAQHLERFAPTAGAAFRRLLDMVAERAEESEAEPPRLAHGDLKAEHVLMSPSGHIVLIDFETCSSAEPGLDVGRVLADVRWALLASGHSSIPEAHQRFLSGYTREGPVAEERLHRARLYELVAFLRTGVRCVRLWDPRWRAATETALAWATSAAQELLPGT